MNEDIILTNDSITELPDTYHCLPDDANAPAEEVMDDFFHALLKKDWEAAYLRLSLQDRSRVTLSEFISWREAVTHCFDMKDYAIQYIKPHDCIVLDQITYSDVVEFQVSITDIDHKFDEETRDSIRKYCVCEDTVWRVCLGIHNISYSIQQYERIYQSILLSKSDAISQYQMQRRDTLTGLLNEAVFYEEANREVARNQRYHNPFSLLTFQINCPDSTKLEENLKHLAGIIYSACRATDLAARLDNNQIICLLTETKMENAEAAARKFLSLVKERAGEAYTVSFGLVFYNGYSSLSDAVNTCCHIAGLPAHY